MRIFSHKHRPMHLGPFPLERLPRSHSVPEYKQAGKWHPRSTKAPDHPNSMAVAFQDYIDLFDRMRLGDAAPRQAPIPADPQARADHLKAGCYNLDVSMAATCAIPAQAVLAEPIVNQSLAQAQEKEYLAGSAANAMAESTVREGQEAWQRSLADAHQEFNHDYALIMLVEYIRDPKPDTDSEAWLIGTQPQRAAVRAAEAAAVMVNYIRILGFAATLHTATASDLDLDYLLLCSGLGEVVGSNGSSRVTNPYLGDQFGMAVVSTTMELAADAPLAKRGMLAALKSHGPGWWLGLAGTRPGYKGKLYKNRPFRLGPYPMEKLKTVAQPTTLIDRPQVPRIPKRHDMFIRSALGDLGEKVQQELDNFRMITKSPYGHAMIPPLGAMVPLQYGQEAAAVTPHTDDPKRNAEAVKAALYYLGADMVGICELPEYAWYSHDTDGSEIKPYHKYGIAVLIDQGYETMAGASGDDWISGAQSMRAYLRAQLLGGIVGNHIRALGYAARGHSVMDQDVLHIPIILEAGLGELSRIGELVLNPYVGPRFKSGIITTNMPLLPDKPIDFGLQDFCEKCTKCARECPCQAIPYGDKIMFNGYEMWKPDVEKCARYRITNPAGSMCGRCMKTCPWNIEGVLSERPFLWAAMNLPFTRKWIARLDDKVGNGLINPVKKWWWDLDSDREGNIIPAKRTNRRQFSKRTNMDPAKQSMGCYPADIASPPVAEKPVILHRKLAVQKYKSAESPEKYQARIHE
ncbi:MAG: hypothetical protein OXD47_08790 [Gammaproteobacteria bacterium]|nr:hypothetical protein [Gammaproteobacteria bacterium]